MPRPIKYGFVFYLDEKTNSEVCQMKDYKIEFEICSEDFDQAFGRKPKNEKEFREFCEFCEKGLRNGHIDWNIIFNCAKDAMKG